jgi:hypothetical protein
MATCKHQQHGPIVSINLQQPPESAPLTRVNAAPATPTTNIFRRTRESVNSAQLQQPTPSAATLPPSSDTGTPSSAGSRSPSPPLIDRQTHYHPQQNPPTIDNGKHIPISIATTPSTPALSSTNPPRHTSKGAIINPRRGSPTTINHRGHSNQQLPMHFQGCALQQQPQQQSQRTCPTTIIFSITNSTTNIRRKKRTRVC